MIDISDISYISCVCVFEPERTYYSFVLKAKVNQAADKICLIPGGIFGFHPKIEIRDKTVLL